MSGLSDVLRNLAEQPASSPRREKRGMPAPADIPAARRTDRGAEAMNTPPSKPNQTSSASDAPPKPRGGRAHALGRSRASLPLALAAAVLLVPAAWGALVIAGVWAADDSAADQQRRVAWAVMLAAGALAALLLAGAWWHGRQNR